MLNLSGEQKKHLKLVLDVAIGVGPGRPALETVVVEVKPELTTFVTADGFRLASMRFHDSDVQETFTINVDAKAFKKLLPGGKKPVELAVSERGVVVGEVYSAIPVEVTYPDWRAILPKANEPTKMDESFQWQFAETLIKLYGEEGEMEWTGWLNQSVHDEDVEHENGTRSWSSHVWAWTRNAVEYLYILMPLKEYPKMEFDSLGRWRDIEKEGVRETGGGVPGKEGAEIV